MNEKIYKCECGKEFTKPNSFNGHKSRCLVHLEAHGKLEAFYAREENVAEKISAIQRERNATIKQEKLNKWIEEKHECEHCGKVMIELYGSGRFCSQSCANSHEFSVDVRAKIGARITALTKEAGYVNATKQAAINRYLANPSYCCECGVQLPYERKLSQRCSCCDSTKHRKSEDKLLHEYLQNPRYCAYCNKELPFERRKLKYCGDKCYRKSMSKQRKEKFERGEITYSNVRLNYKYGTYKGISCDSSWELAYILYLFDNNIKFERNRTQSFEYVYNGETHRFFPDFIVDKKFVEVKSRHSDETDAKVAAIPKNVSFQILYGDDIQFYLDYAVKTYGKEFTRLYDRNYPSWMDK